MTKQLLREDAPGMSKLLSKKGTESEATHSATEPDVYQGKCVLEPRLSWKERELSKRKPGAG